MPLVYTKAFLLTLTQIKCSQISWQEWMKERNIYTYDNEWNMYNDNTKDMVNVSIELLLNIMVSRKKIY